MPTVYGVVHSTLKSLRHVILCKYRQDKLVIQYSVHVFFYVKACIEPVHDKTNKMTCVPREDSNQPV